MKIKGIQKTTLIDYPGKVACTIFLQSCNFRCRFCHNPELVLYEEEGEMSEKEFFDFLEKRKGELDGVCITGGEPLVSLDKDFVKKIKELGYFVKLDTNGSFPEKLKEFVDAGLVDFVAMDLKTCKEDYEEIVGVGVNIKNLEKSIRIISSLENYEFRTTVLKKFHDEEKIKKMLEWVSGIVDGKIKRFCLQGFKNKGKLIDEGLRGEADAGVGWVESLAKVSNKFCNQVIVRV